MKTINDYKYSQRAVAPIIATLLMVAISVVGGILIFVFAQGFFTDTNIGSPAIESLNIYGYDANDNPAAIVGGVTLTGIRPHNFDPSDTALDLLIPGISTTAADRGKLIDAEPIGIYVRNLGTTTVVISSVKIYGDNYTPVSQCTTALATRTFAIYDGIEATPCTDGPVIQPGRDATVVIAYNDDANGEVKLGRPIPVILVTSNGASFTKIVQNGVQLGGG